MPGAERGILPEPILAAELNRSVAVGMNSLLTRLPWEQAELIRPAGFGLEQLMQEQHNHPLLKAQWDVLGRIAEWYLPRYSADDLGVLRIPAELEEERMALLQLPEVCGNQATADLRNTSFFGYGGSEEGPQGWVGSVFLGSEVRQQVVFGAGDPRFYWLLTHATNRGVRVPVEVLEYKETRAIAVLMTPGFTRPATTWFADPAERTLMPAYRWISSSTSPNMGVFKVRGE